MQLVEARPDFLRCPLPNISAIALTIFLSTATLGQNENGCIEAGRLLLPGSETRIHRGFLSTMPAPNMPRRVRLCRTVHACLRACMLACLHACVLACVRACVCVRVRACVPRAVCDPRPLALGPMAVDSFCHFLSRVGPAIDCRYLRRSCTAPMHSF